MNPIPSQEATAELSDERLKELGYAFGDRNNRFIDIPLMRAAIAADRAQFRPPTTTKIQCNEDGSLDEVFGTGDFHLEQMDSNHWWMALETSAGRVVVSLRSRQKIIAYVEAEPPFPRVPEVDHREALYDAIEQVLLHHKMHNWCSDEDGEDALGLVDRLCDHEAKDISSGQHEVRLICDAIYSDDGVRAVLAACFAGGSPAKDVEAPAAINQDVIDAKRYRFIRDEPFAEDIIKRLSDRDDWSPELADREIDAAIRAAGPIEGEGV